MVEKDEVISRARGFDKHDLAKVCEGALKRFDHRKYVGASNFSIVEWGIALEGRFHYLTDSTRVSGGNLCKDSDPWPWNGFRVWHALRLLDEPLNVGYRRREEDSFVERTVYEMDLASAWCARDAICDMPEEKRICELWWEFMTEHKTDPTEINWELEADVIAFFQRAAEERRAKEEKFDGVFGSYSEALDRKGDDHGGRFLHVNTSAPDAVIVEHFKQWLAAFRASERGRGSRGLSISDTDIRKWAQNRVLAYLDVTQFCKWSGLKFSAHKIGSMIFPDITDVDVAEKVRKTTAPLALSLVEGDMLEAIRLMANAATLGEVE